MEDIRITFRDLALYIVIANVVFGVLLGFFPLLAGFSLANRKLALIGFIACLIGGTFLGLFLSYPLALIFVWLIVRSPKSGEATATDAVSS